MPRSLSKAACVVMTVALSVTCAAGAQAAQRSHLASSGQVSGTITALGADQFTIQTAGKPVGVLNALTAAANRVSAQDLPYVWGGGHAQAGIASRGEKGGPGYNGKRIGYDCSGAVVAVLVAGGLWPQGSGVPNDWGVIKYLLRQKLIAPGAGTGPTEVTLYDNPGVHIFMNIDGRFWGTSDGGGGGDAKGGPGWLDDGAWDVTNKHYRRYHFVSSAIKAKTSAGYTMTFYTSPASTLLPSVGTRIKVSYSTSKYGTMLADATNYTPPAPPATTLTAAGAVTAIAADDSSFTIQAADGSPMTFEVTPGSAVAAQLTSAQIAVSSVVSVIYTTTLTPTPTPPGQTTTPPPTQTLTAVAVTVNAPPPPPTSGGGGIIGAG